MPVNDFLISVTGCTGLRGITYRQGYSRAAAQAVVQCTSHTLDIGESIADVTFGVNGNEGTYMESGYVKNIQYNKPPGLYEITIEDVLSLAMADFLASDDPESPFEANNVEASVLVGQLLAHAGITAYSGDATAFTFAPNGPTPINLVSVWSAIDNICRITGMVCYAESDGTVRFTTRKPYIVGGDTSALAILTGGSGQIEQFSYERSDSGLRNRVVVYGPASVRATASAASAYLPVGFYKTLAIGHELIATNAMAQATADLNLTMFNRLTETVSLRMLGNPLMVARQVVDVTESESGLSADEFIVYSVEHVLGPQGYSVQATLVR